MAIRAGLAAQQLACMSQLALVYAMRGEVAGPSGGA